MSQGVFSKHKEVCISTNVNGPADTFERNNGSVVLDNSEQEGLNKEGDNVDVPEFAAIQKKGDPSTLSLHNSFDILQEDSELPSGEAELADKEPNHISNATLLESTEIVEKVSKLTICLDQDANPKVSDNMANDTYEPAFLNTNNTIMDTDKGTLHIPTSGPALSEQHNKTGRHLFLSVAAGLVDIALDPITNLQVVLTEKVPCETPIVMPVTITDEVLGPDKGKFSKPVIKTNNAAACKKSEIILRKFWADDLDMDQTSDSTLEPDINVEIEGDIQDESLFTPFMSRRQKKSNKKKQVNKLNDTMTQSTSSEHIQTRSKKGVIKRNPKYL